MQWREGRGAEDGVREDVKEESRMAGTERGRAPARMKLLRRPIASIASF